jgi:hypothetical protein
MVPLLPLKELWGRGGGHGLATLFLLEILFVYKDP